MGSCPGPASCPAGAHPKRPVCCPLLCGRRRLLARLKTTLDAFANSSDARRLVQAHILPDRPWHTKLLPPGASTLPSLDPQGGAVTAVVVASGGRCAGASPARAGRRSNAQGARVHASLRTRPWLSRRATCSFAPLCGVDGCERVAERGVLSCCPLLWCHPQRRAHAGRSGQRGARHRRARRRAGWQGEGRARMVLALLARADVLAGKLREGVLASACTCAWACRLQDGAPPRRHTTSGAASLPAPAVRHARDQRRGAALRGAPNHQHRSCGPRRRPQRRRALPAAHRVVAAGGRQRRRARRLRARQRHGCHASGPQPASTGLVRSSCLACGVAALHATK